MASVFSFQVSPYILTNAEIKPQFRVRVQSSDGGDSTVLSSDSVRVNVTGQKEKNGTLINGGTEEKEEKKVLIGGNGRLKSKVERKWVKDVVSEDLQVSWDDGYGTKTVKDYLEETREVIKPNGGSPRFDS